MIMIIIIFLLLLLSLFLSSSSSLSLSSSSLEVDIDIDVDAQFQADFAVLKDVAGPESRLATEQLQKVIFHAIENLPEELNTAVTLRELEGMSYEEIAEVMECPVGTVRSRIFRARESIEKSIEATG